MRGGGREGGREGGRGGGEGVTGGAGSAQTELGDTPLHLAASHGNAQVVSHRSCSQLPP